MRGVDFTGIAYLAALGLVGFVVYEVIVNRKAIGNLVNPASSDNVVNRGVESVGQTLTGDKNWTLGGWIYEITHPNAPYSRVRADAPTPRGASSPTAFQKSLSDVWL